MLAENAPPSMGSAVRLLVDEDEKGGNVRRL